MHTMRDNADRIEVLSETKVVVCVVRLPETTDVSLLHFYCFGNK